MVEESGRFSVGGIGVSEVGKLLFLGTIFAEMKDKLQGANAGSQPVCQSSSLPVKKISCEI